MPGHDKSRIVGLDQDQLEHFVCGICEDVLNDPIVTQCCRQSYCRQCIDEWLKDGMTCPNDSSAIAMGELREVPSFVVNFINKLRIKCKSYKKGCDVVVNIEDYVEHCENCIYSYCNICGCKAPRHDHVCIDFLIDDNINLMEELDRCKNEITSLKTYNERLSRNLKILKSKKLYVDFDQINKNLYRDITIMENKIEDLERKNKFLTVVNTINKTEETNLKNESIVLKNKLKIYEKAWKLNYKL